MSEKKPHAIKMIDTWVDRIKSDKVQEDWYDTHTKGLVLRVSRSGKKVWYLFYRDPLTKKNGRYKLGNHPPMSLADARGKINAHKGDIAEGGNPVERRRAERKGETFGEMAAEYIERWAKPRKRSWKKDEDAIKRDLDGWMHRKAKDIKKRDVLEVLDTVMERGSAIQANRTLALIRKIFNWGISRDIVDANPCAQVEPPTPENRRDRVLSDDEIRAFWKACDSLQHVVAASFRFRLVTAQRGGEVMSMRWVDVDLSGKWWTIPAGRAKNKIEHRVPLTDQAIVILNELEETSKGSPWVFPSRMKPDEPITNPHASAKKLRKEMTKLLELDEEISFDLHDLRRTAASNMASMGVSRLVISRVLNHAEGGVTWIYDRYSYDQEKRQALERWAKKLSKVVSATPAKRQSSVVVEFARTEKQEPRRKRKPIA